VLHTLGDFWTKSTNDWIMNLSGLLAYNLLMSVFPILLVLLAIASFVLNTLAPGSFSQLVPHLQRVLPGGSGIFEAKTLATLDHSAGLVLVIGVAVALVTGSRLFITLESCFGIIFRLRARDALHQHAMAVACCCSWPCWCR
jgi:uncharacterized BrkB/YihY/UPF0761 family membrane protein